MNNENQYRLIGPFREVLTMTDLPLKGALQDQQLHIEKNAGILIKGDRIERIADFELLRSESSYPDLQLTLVEEDTVVIPGMIDVHTHIAFAGTRANDFALRNAGSSYLEIAESGGGIWSTVKDTRAATTDDLVHLILERAAALIRQGITTIEVKSGYGLNVEEELKILRAIKQAAKTSKAQLIPTCLAAHTLPKDFEGSHEAYLEILVKELFPVLKEEQLSNRIDTFVEKSAFSKEQIKPYFEAAKALGFDITVHADQFSTSGSEVAVAFAARSADHLESSGTAEIELLAASDVIPVALPGASMGIGCAFTPARRLLDAGASLAIATDWNPGSAPMGHLLTQASVLACFEKLSNAEVFAGVTYRAAAALGLSDRGILSKGAKADFVLFPTDSIKEITYHQGRLEPIQVWIDGAVVFDHK